MNFLVKNIDGWFKLIGGTKETPIIYETYIEHFDYWKELDGKIVGEDSFLLTNTKTPVYEKNGVNIKFVNVAMPFENN
jgi:hypothetical protein